MNLGTQSGPVMPGPEPMAYLDKYYELGGNFIDVANNCHCELGVLAGAVGGRRTGE
jgi:aryl-alcohol dehydrogenase-like predicted oxidoreductase